MSFTAQFDANRRGEKGLKSSRREKKNAGACRSGKGEEERAFW